MPPLSEADTRAKLIDPALKMAGWDVNDPQRVGLEIPVDGFDPQAWRELEKQLRRIREQNKIYEAELPAGICDYALYRENPRAYINQHLILLRLKQMLPVFVAGYYCTPNGKAQILRLDREGVKSGLNFDDVRGLKVFKPPLALQEKFACIVRQYDRLRAQQRESLRQAEMLFGALLEGSFQPHHSRELRGTCG
jgi:hypothetical protein